MNSLLLSVTAGKCLPGGTVPPLDGAFDSGTASGAGVSGNSGGICNLYNQIRPVLPYQRII